MNILLIDTNGVGLDFAIRCQDAGHKVKVYLMTPTSGVAPRFGDGIVQKVTDWKPHMRWADLIVIPSNSKYHDDLQPYFEKHYPIFGCNPQAARLELDREFGQEALRTCGIETLPYEKFTNYDKAIRFVEAESPKLYVSKPFGDVDRGLSYVPTQPSDLVFKLERWRDEDKIQPSFLLQEAVSDGIEMAVGGWFGPTGFSQWICENFEEKKLMNDGLGINVGEMGTILRYVNKSYLFDCVLEPMTDFLHGLNYVGYVDMNTIISDGEPWPLEWTMRLGDPTWRIQTALHEGDPAEWMLDLVNGKDSLSVSRDIAVGVQMVHGDFPYSKFTKKTVTGFPISGLTADNRDHVHFKEVMHDEAPAMMGNKIKRIPMMVTAGDEVLVVTGTGKTVSAAAKAAYDVAWDIKFPSNRGFRTDIGCRLESELPELQKHGFAKGMNY